jgi:hypothetical protein
MSLCYYKQSVDIRRENLSRTEDLAWLDDVTHFEGAGTYWYSTGTYFTSQCALEFFSTA